MLDLSPLEASLSALSRALSVTSDAQQWAAFDSDTQEALRAGVIQMFEVAYEQSWKAMRHWLLTSRSACDVEGVSMRQLYRLALNAGLIDDIEVWMQFQKARNQTSHTFDCGIAQTVFELVPQLVAPSRLLLGRLAAPK